MQDLAEIGWEREVFRGRRFSTRKLLCDKIIVRQGTSWDLGFQSRKNHGTTHLPLWLLVWGMVNSKWGWSFNLFIMLAMDKLKLKNWLNLKVPEIVLWWWRRCVCVFKGNPILAPYDRNDGDDNMIRIIGSENRSTILVTSTLLHTIHVTSTVWSGL